MTLTSCCNLLSGSSDTNDDALTPTLVARLESTTHNVDVTGAVKGVIATTVGHLNELLLDGLTILQFLGVHKVGSAKLLGPFLLAVIHIDNDDLGGLVLDTALNDTQTDTSGTKDGDVGSLLNTTLAGRDDGSSVTGRDTASEQASAVHWCLFRDLDDRDVRNDGVLRKGRSAHEVQKVLALALEARSAVRHDTLALSGTNLAAEVGLAGFAELALAALRCAAQSHWLANAYLSLPTKNSNGRECQWRLKLEKGQVLL